MGDMEDEDLNKAAVKIQSTFRGHKSRAAIPEKEEEHDSVVQSETASEEPAETVEVISTETTPATVSESAEDKGTAIVENVEDEGENEEEDENYGLDMEDEDLNRAAVKIQSTFRGHKSRSALP